MPHTTPPTYTATSAARHTERLGDEALVYDVATDTVLHLAPNATSVWEACGRSGTTGATASGISSSTGLSIERVDVALTELIATGLVATNDGGGISRRTFGRKVALGTAAAAGLSLITAVGAPTPAMASSGEIEEPLCPPTFIPFDGKCFCPEGTVEIDGKCIERIQCGEGEILSPEGVCVPQEP